MEDLTQKTARFLSKYADRKIAIGVSGGRDSMCLLYAVMHCGVVLRDNMIAVHVNHGLRKTAARDESFVRDFCVKNDIKFISYAVDVKGECAKNRLTVEQAARSLRYGIFYELIKSRVADCVLTAHHALDNAESILMHLFRGAGLDGLRGLTNDAAGVNEALPLHMFRGAGLDGLRGIEGDAVGEKTLPPIVRPFADVYPEELDEYCSRNDLKYVVDETNFETDADRNFLRLRVIPLIEQRYKGAVRAINELARECRSACEVLDAALDMSLIVYDRGAILVSDAALKSGLGGRYVRKALEYFSLVDVTREQISGVTALAGMRTGAVSELANGVKAVHEYGAVALYVPRPRYGGETPLVLGKNFLDGLAMDVAEREVRPDSVRGGAVDLAALDGAVIRFRRDGDMFTPYGGGTKKLKQYFTDNKIPGRVRDRIPLVCRGSTVLAVVGIQVSEQAAVRGDTARKGVISLRA